MDQSSTAKLATALLKRFMANVSIDTIPYDTGLEAPFAHSLHSVYFCRFTPCCLPRLTLNPNHCDRLANLGPPNSTNFFW